MTSMTAPLISIFSTGDYDAQVQRGAEILHNGGLVVLPTETVYGVAGLVTQPVARERLHVLRGDANNGANRPFTIHLAHASDADQYLGDVSDLGRRMMKKLWPGPVGLVFDVQPERRREIAERLAVPPRDLFAGDEITLRCPDHIVAADVIRSVDGPVVLTVPPSAVKRASAAAELTEALDGRVDLTFDAGPSSYSMPSTIIKISGERYEVVRTGVYDRRIVEKLLRTTILFVCSGNTCRSPMAEAIARHLLAQKEGISDAELEKKGISVVSAGVFAMPGARATQQAIDAVRAHGADLASHRSRPLTIEMINLADRIYTMGSGHAAAVIGMAPMAADKVQTLDPEGDIDDPIGGDLSLYQELAGQMQKLIERRLEEIK